MPTQFKLFNFLGIPVYIQIWFLLIFFFVTPLMVLAIFISVLIHEMAHAFAADRLGYSVSKIDLNFFGGAAHIDNMTNIHERDSFRIVAAGPLITAILFIISRVCITGSKSPIDQFFTEMTFVNFILFVFNILPIYPLDGGRMLRDFLYIKLKNRKVAFKSSAVVSLVFSLALLSLGIVKFLPFLILFSLLFTYLALKDLGIIKS